jgi:hypothetical protein
VKKEREKKKKNEFVYVILTLKQIIYKTPKKPVIGVSIYSFLECVSL